MPVTVIGWAGILAGYSALFIAMRRRSGIGRVILMLLLVSTQTAVSLYFYQWAQSNPTDSHMYYFDPYHHYELGFGLSTQFVVWLVQSIKGWTGGTYLDFFLVFQATGSWGAAFLIRTFDDIYDQASMRLPDSLFLLLFIPGIHFWTAFLGKDGPLFLAASICAWAAINIRLRWLAFGSAIVIMVLFRPHIALLAVASLAAAVFFDKRTRGLAKLSLGGLALAGVAVVALTVQSTFQLNVADADAVAEYLNRSNEVFEKVEGSSNLASSSYATKLFSLLFRPFFFDAAELAAVVASLENLVLLVIFCYIAAKFTLLLKLLRHVLAVRYALIFSWSVILLLSMVYYNVGLGLRQKIMMYPTLLAIFVAVTAASRVQSRLMRSVGQARSRTQETAAA